MLRKTVLLLALANGAAWFWYQGGWADMGQHALREPERLERQLHPEWVHVRQMPTPAAGSDADQPRLPEPAPAPDTTVPAMHPPAAMPPIDAPETSEPPPAEEQASFPDNQQASEPMADRAQPTPSEPAPASEAAPVNLAASEPAPEPAPAPAPAAVRCLQAGPFNTAQATALRSALANWPSSSWRMDSAQAPGRWMVLLRTPDASSMNQRRAELRGRNIDVDFPAVAFRPGLSLGRFSSEEAARQEVTNLARKGVRGLQVVLERPEANTHKLVLPRADQALQQRAQALDKRLMGAQTWQSCD